MSAPSPTAHVPGWVLVQTGAGLLAHPWVLNPGRLLVTGCREPWPRGLGRGPGHASGWVVDGGLRCSPGDNLFLGRFFIGTSVSTFSFRIHEEREILGLDPKTTYNRFCGDEEKACEQPTHWRIAY